MRRSDNRGKNMKKVNSLLFVALTISFLLFLQIPISSASASAIIDYPSNGATVSGTVIIRVRIYGDGGYLYIDGVQKRYWSSSGSKTYTWDTTQYSDGTHQIKLTAYDYDPFDWDTDIINVYVNNNPTKYAWIIIGDHSGVTDSHRTMGDAVYDKLVNHGYNGRCTKISCADDEPNFEYNIETEFENLFEVTDSNDQILLYIVSNGGVGYINCGDTGRTLSYSEMRSWIDDPKEQRTVILVIDACNSASAWDSFSSLADVFCAAANRQPNPGWTAHAYTPGSEATPPDENEYRVFSYFFFEESEVTDHYWHETSVAACFYHAEAETENRRRHWEWIWYPWWGQWVLDQDPVIFGIGTGIFL
jgi:hypothetical protein